MIPEYRGIVSLTWGFIYMVYQVHFLTLENGLKNACLSDGKAISSLYSMVT